MRPPRQSPNPGGRHVTRSAERANIARSEMGRRLAGTAQGSPWPASPRRPNIAGAYETREMPNLLPDYSGGRP
jgi:hypothetical protein